MLTCATMTTEPFDELGEFGYERIADASSLRRLVRRRESGIDVAGRHGKDGDYGGEGKCTHCIGR